MIDWVDVNKKMPEKGRAVVVSYMWGGYGIDCWNDLYERPVLFSSESVCVGEGWEDSEPEDVTHWAYLDEPIVE